VSSGTVAKINSSVLTLNFLSDEISDEGVMDGEVVD